MDADIATVRANRGGKRANGKRNWLHLASLILQLGDHSFVVDRAEALPPSMRGEGRSESEASQLGAPIDIEGI